MIYSNITHGLFLSRPNRFTALVEINGQTETVHVKNTGRGRELFVPGADVFLYEPGTIGRKTRYDLVAVRKKGGLLVNYDSQAPIKVVKEWLSDQKFDKVIPEFSFGDSRIDFYMEQAGGCYLMEVKGCTLEINGVGYFPDAPTDRGIRHLHELVHAQREGYHAVLAFVIQMDGVEKVRPNISIHPEFGIAFEEAKKAGVRIMMLPCHVEPDSLNILPGNEII